MSGPRRARHPARGVEARGTSGSGGRALLGPRGRRLDPRSSGPWPGRCRVGGRQIEAPADVIAEDIRLVYGLVCAGLAEFGRTVGRKQDHGNAVGRGLHDGRKSVGDRRARGRDPGRRTPRGARNRGCEGGPRLVEVDEATGSFVRGERRDQGRRARAGATQKKSTPQRRSSSTIRYAQRRLARGVSLLKPEHPREVADLLLDLGPLFVGHGAGDDPGPRERGRASFPAPAPSGYQRRTRSLPARSNRQGRRTSPGRRARGRVSAPAPRFADARRRPA